jgi:hypothetical protein
MYFMRLLACVLLAGAGPIYAQAEDASSLEASARSIIQKRCLSCHNAETKTSGLALVDRESAVKGGAGGPALVPNNPEESLLWKKVSAGQMPPGNPVPEQERLALRRWIEAGAPWTGAIGTPGARRRAGSDWWSLQPLRSIPTPSVPDIPTEWSRSAIDRFLYAKLRDKGLHPSPPADRRTLIRRATFDLLGLPPTPEEIEAFVNDKGHDAYEKLIDRLLASPHYGERWGRHWLDVIAFGESHGYEQNHLRDRAWPFRDYVIRSFNEDKPFNRMILEQLAGDQIAPDDPQIEVATGFLVSGVHDTVKIENIEGELQKRANDLDGMVSTTGAAFLGLTVNCARCHDHKFDPIQQLDYYRFQAAFAGVEHAERGLATAEEEQQRLQVEGPLQEKLKSLEARLAELRTQAEPLIAGRRSEIISLSRPPVDSRGTEEQFSPTLVKFVRMTIDTTTHKSPPAIDELEIWTHGSVPANVALASAGARATARSTRSTMTATEAYGAENLIDGKFDKVWISGESGAGQITIELAKSAVISRIFWSRDRPGGFQGRFLSQVPTSYVFESSVGGKQWQKIADAAGRLPFDQSEREEFILLSVLRPEQQQEWRTLKNAKAAVEKQLADLPKLPTVYIGRFNQPKEPSHLLKRGNPMDRGETVAPASLGVLSKMVPAFELAPESPEGERRLALARWIADERNALTARVLANRIWHYHFGKGIVGTPSDFGFNGEKPTHPELLDWLANRVVELGWRLKPLHKELMLTAAYRQSSAYNEQAAAVDADARYLWRYPPRRLEAEAIRDSILAVSGKLDRSTGGPGFRLYKYTVDNVATYLPLEEFPAETFRRSVYHQAARSVRDDMLGTHDCPDTTQPEPKRVVTTSPLQALTLLNNRFSLDQARYFAERLAREAGDGKHESQVERAYQLAFGRSPKPQEKAAGLELIRKHGLTIFCRVLFNANEFVYVM